MQSLGSALLSLNGSPYRGELTFAASDSGLAEVNTLPVEEYLLGVVPLEMGERPPGDSAAEQAQAVTARSYAYIHLSPARSFDVTSGVLDQLYGGVAGIHRLLEHRARLTEARVIICIAGMEGALPSVVGGLVAVPVIAVPTSVGYGASFGGVAALLGMLNSCASNVTVVNIDNGFGAACVASCINRL